MAPAAQTASDRAAGPASTPPVGHYAALPAWRRWMTGWHVLNRFLRCTPDDPEFESLVVLFNVNVNCVRYQELARELMGSDEGRRLLEDRPLPGAAPHDAATLAELPKDSLGESFARFCGQRGIKPLHFEACETPADYVAAWLRAIHDVEHVVTGYGTDPLGEAELQMFNLSSLGTRSALMAIPRMFPILVRRQRGSLDSVCRRLGAAYLRGRKARSLALFRFDEHWATPLARVRELLNLATPDAAVAA
jgi:ubiquinone biosynthesis protein COQ4